MGNLLNPRPGMPAEGAFADGDAGGFAGVAVVEGHHLGGHPAEILQLRLLAEQRRGVGRDAWRGHAILSKTLNTRIRLLNPHRTPTEATNLALGGHFGSR